MAAEGDIGQRRDQIYQLIADGLYPQANNMQLDFAKDFAIEQSFKHTSSLLSGKFNTLIKTKNQVNREDFNIAVDDIFRSVLVLLDDILDSAATPEVP